MGKTLDERVQDRLGARGYYYIWRLSPRAWGADWNRQYACGVISDPRYVETISRQAALRAILNWEDDADAQDSGGHICSTCFPPAAAGREGA